MFVLIGVVQSDHAPPPRIGSDLMINVVGLILFLIVKPQIMNSTKKIINPWHIIVINFDQFFESLNWFSWFEYEGFEMFIFVGKTRQFTFTDTFLSVGLFIQYLCEPFY